MYRLQRTSSRMALCRLFKEKTLTQRAKIIAENKICFSFLNDEHSFRKCPNPRKKERSSNNTLLHGTERIFPSRPKPGKQSQSLNNSSESCHQKLHDSLASLNSVTFASMSDVKGLPQLVKVNLSSFTCPQTARAICDLSCSNS